MPRTEPRFFIHACSEYLDNTKRVCDHTPFDLGIGEEIFWTLYARDFRMKEWNPIWAIADGNSLQSILQKFDVLSQGFFMPRTGRKHLEICQHCVDAIL